jgi:hypothetical protein
MSDEIYEIEVFKNLDNNSKENTIKSPKHRDFPKERFYDTTFYIIFYAKKSSEFVRKMLTKKNLNLKKFTKIEDKDLNNIKINQNIFFFFYNIDKKMIRALMKKDHRKEKIIDLPENEIKLDSSNRYFILEKLILKIFNN